MSPRICLYIAAALVCAISVTLGQGPIGQGTVTAIAPSCTWESIPASSQMIGATLTLTQKYDDAGRESTWSTPNKDMKSDYNPGKPEFVIYVQPGGIQVTKTYSPIIANFLYIFTVSGELPDYVKPYAQSMPNNKWKLALNFKYPSISNCAFSGFNSKIESVTIQRLKDVV